jgi:hypothetical protein
MFSRWRAKQDTVVYIGAPAVPMSGARHNLLKDAVSGMAGVLFAYVPHIYMQGKIDPPKQIIFLVLENSWRNKVAEVMEPLMADIHRRLPKDDFIDVMPVFTDNSWMTKLKVT